LFEKILNWFGICEHVYQVLPNFTTYYNNYTKSVGIYKVEFRDLFYIFHMNCQKCGTLKTETIKVEKVGAEAEPKEYLNHAKTSLSLKYKIRDKF
jgi:hypothetical protein